ncbi:MAG: hypothetical protein NPIRA02_22530 [Nitrospirales bacterium]|nr:MAG: hypothetical protein NPIRA02_22530 [Nitrospirales bacterium]
MIDHTRLSPHAWDYLSHQLFGADNAWITPPQKLFLWNAQGIYIDYYYPNPEIVHLVGGEYLLGKRISKVLPQPMARGVRSSIVQTLDLQQPHIEYYELTMQKQLYRVAVRFLPFLDKVLGLVNDLPNLQEENAAVGIPQQHRLPALSHRKP